MWPPHIRRRPRRCLCSLQRFQHVTRLTISSGCSEHISRGHYGPGAQIRSWPEAIPLRLGDPCVWTGRTRRNHVKWAGATKLAVKKILGFWADLTTPDSITSDLCVARAIGLFFVNSRSHEWKTISKHQQVCLSTWTSSHLPRYYCLMIIRRSISDCVCLRVCYCVWVDVR